MFRGYENFDRFEKMEHFGDRKEKDNARTEEYKRKMAEFNKHFKSDKFPEGTKVFIG
jgi:hypothetical protein